MAQDKIESLHVASFTGNIGDNANHNGTRRTLKQNTGLEFSFTESEIRKYYQNYQEPDSLAFDDEFVETANNHDLVLIGSGNFFELWIEESNTGTTIDMTTDVVDSISSPIVFYGLGCDPYKGIPGNNREKFEGFLDHILSADHCLVSVRNDGSLSHISRIFGAHYADRIHKVPDGGFFTEVDDHHHPEIVTDHVTIALNVATDMSNLRFPQNDDSEHTYESFIEEMAHYINYMLDLRDDLDFVLMPHIYSDLRAISDLMDSIDLLHRRNRITTAPYLNGEGSERYIFDIYRKVDLAMGLRFHTNVCSIGQTTPSIGLVSYPKVGDLYETELEIPQRAIDVKQTGFATQLIDLSIDSINRKTEISNMYEDICNELRKDITSFHTEIKQHIQSE